ncbi:MAG: GTP cyclohydrolase I FolE [Patescibacteria group bacterium]|nr:GTP cyclohydrolase I FolE [Patescibacteria group bacterium]
MELKGYIREIIKEIGENPEREGLLKTPLRVENSLRYLTRGYHLDVRKILNEALFEENVDQMIVVKDIDLFSLCEHHLLPFFGLCHVAYLPDKKIVGLSKIPRIVEVFSRRLQVQERLTTQIANTLQELLNPLGVAVVIEAKHLCMIMRVVEQRNTNVTTSCMLGVFREDKSTRMEFMNLINKP